MSLYYTDYISEKLRAHLLGQATPVGGVEGLVEVGKGRGLETDESLTFLADLYRSVQSELGTVLDQRMIDRRFMDERVQACFDLNENLGRDILDPDYKTIIGLEDSNGRIVLGPNNENYCRRGGAAIAEIPDFLKPPHVTLFGPPDSAKMAINAMNAYHRKLKEEPPIVEELLKTQHSNPKWGADDEDSKTPLRDDLIDAAVNLTACFDGDIQVEGQAKYQLAESYLSLPIKRFPGLALPCTFLFLDEKPIPLHLYDFALHVFANWHNPEALVFYVPKLENEEEAAYIHQMVASTERMIHAAHPEYVLGSVRLMVVLENPRAILRAHEIMDALYPYFVGASLGWHDYLGSTARVFKNDANYRIPVKADPNIVIKYIKASHHLLAEAVGSRGGIKVGGMYGILPLDNELQSPSFQMTILGFLKDVITQMKRDLTGFWVAHPDFVRLGLALVEAWRFHAAGESDKLETFVKALLVEDYHQEILDFIYNDDIEGLDLSDPNYVRSLLVADIKESDFIANNDPEEIRYNVFQSLQYITDWLSGNGCVALPAIVNGVAVRVMDDLATAERSRWEVWHEIFHGRFSKDELVKIAHEEMHFIRKDLSNDQKIVQVKWTEQTARWYPLAMEIMLQLMTDPNPPEFATELLLPFTLKELREAPDPWATIQQLDPTKYKLCPEVEAFHYYFEACGCASFARAMAGNALLDLEAAKKLILAFTRQDVVDAASFHGNIGENSKSLDAQAAREQAGMQGEDQDLVGELQTLGEAYVQRFGFKFLISAKGKSGAEMLAVLKARLERSPEEELTAARTALWEITEKRMSAKPLDTGKKKVKALLEKHQIHSASVAVNRFEGTQSLSFGDCHKHTYFQIASLSKTVASYMALQYFATKGIALDTSVNSLFEETPSSFRLTSDEVTLRHLLSHRALNIHYVAGYPLDQEMPTTEALLAEVAIINDPGKVFSYSGGGFLVLEHLLESLEHRSIQALTEGLIPEITFCPDRQEGRDYATGYFDDGQEVPGGRLKFPSFAAGALGTSTGMAEFLLDLTRAYQQLEGAGSITHDTAVEMLQGQDLGSVQFMGALMGLGVFVGEAGANKFAIHQGANEGFRALYFQCFKGPDAGKGFVIFANGDNAAVPFIAEVAQLLIMELHIQHMDVSKFRTEFDARGVEQEQMVNAGYKKLIFDAFEPCLPEAISHRGALNPDSALNLAVGSKILKVTDQRFARAENLISPFEPVFDPELFGEQGKIMDSWESARHNDLACHTLELELKEPSQIKGLSLCTKFHDGNQVEEVEVFGFSDTGEWVELLRKTKTLGHARLRCPVEALGHTFSRIRVNTYPDGGLTRLGLFKEPLPALVWSRYPDEIPKPNKPLTLPIDDKDRLGLTLISASDEHYGPAAQVISPSSPIHMFDGFESARSRSADHREELLIQIDAPRTLKRIVFDFRYFVNNNPKFVQVLGLSGGEWLELAQKTNVKAFAGNQKAFLIEEEAPIEQLKVLIFPDGGMNRIRVY